MGDEGDADSKTKKPEDGGVFGSFKSQYSNNNTRNNSEGGNGGNDAPPNFNAPTSLIAGLMLMLFTYMMIRNDDDSVAPADFSREITWNDFCSYLLETGQVEKIVVTNNQTIAKVFLKPGSKGLPQHQNRQFRYSDRRQQLHDSNNANPMFDDSSQMQDGFSSTSSNDEFSTRLNNN